MIVNEAGGGKRLPDLTNPAAASDLAQGKQLIDQEGLIVTGTLPEIADNNNLSVSGYSFNYKSSERVIETDLKTTSDVLLRSSGGLKADVPGTLFGNATAADVKSGKTFTSVDGFYVSGNGNFSELIIYEWTGNNSSLAAIPYSGATTPELIIIYISEGFVTKHDEEDGAIGLWFMAASKNEIYSENQGKVVYQYSGIQGNGVCIYDKPSEIGNSDMGIFLSAGFLYIQLSKEVGAPARRVPLVFDQGVGSWGSGVATYRAVIIPTFN